MACEQRLQRQDAGDASRSQATSDVAIDTKTLEQEWMRRLTETREMYERAIQGYKNQLGELEGKVEAREEAHAQQVQDLVEKLNLEQSRTKQLQDQIEKLSKSQVEGRSEQIGRGEGADDSDESSSSERPSRQKDQDDGSTGRILADTRRPEDTNNRQTRHTEDVGVSVDATRRDQPQVSVKVHDKGSQTTASSALAEGDDEKYAEILRNMAKRLEDLNVGRDEVETTMAVIKETISRCLQEWKISFQREEGARGDDDEVDQLKKNYDELLRKLKGKNKKIEQLQKQCQDVEQQNTKLLHQCSVLQSQVRCFFSVQYSES